MVMVISVKSGQAPAEDRHLPGNGHDGLHGAFAEGVLVPDDHRAIVEGEPDELIEHGAKKLRLRPAVR